MTPVIYYPSEAASIPERCGHCGARLLILSTDYPSRGFPRSDVTCYLCARDACELRHDSIRPKPLTEVVEGLKRGRPAICQTPEEYRERRNRLERERRAAASLRDRVRPEQTCAHVTSSKLRPGGLCGACYARAGLAAKRAAGVGI